VTFSADGKLLASAQLDGKVIVWDALKGKLLHFLTGHEQAVFRMAFVGQSHLLASADVNGTVMVWEANAPQEYTAFGYGGLVACGSSGAELAAAKGAAVKGTAAGFGTRLVNGGPGIRYWYSGIGLWDLVHRKWKSHVDGFLPWVTSLAVSPDGQLVAFAFPVNELSYVKVVDVARKEHLFVRRVHVDEINILSFSLDSRKLVMGGPDRTLIVGDARTGRELLTLRGHTGRVDMVHFNSDGQSIILVAESSPNTAPSALVVKTWDIATGKEVSAVEGPMGRAPLALSGDARFVASAGNAKDFVVHLWEARTGKVLHDLRGHTDSIEAVAFSPDAKRLATGGKDRFVKVWDIQTGQELLSLRGPWGAVRQVVFSPDGTRLILSDGMVYVLESREPDSLIKKDALFALSNKPAPRPLEPWPKDPHGHPLGRVLEPKRTTRDKTAAEVAETVKRAPYDSFAWYWHIHISLKTGGLAAYRRACADMVPHFRAMIGDDALIDVARLCALAPDALTDFDQPLRWMKRTGNDQSGWYELETRGAVYYRAGKFKEAVRSLARAIKTHDEGGHPTSWLFLAMARHRLGQAEEAIKCLARARASYKKALPKEPERWAERLDLELLRREAEKLVRGGPR
jgi:WD40 repeat protein